MNKNKEFQKSQKEKSQKAEKSPVLEKTTSSEKSPSVKKSASLEKSPSVKKSASLEKSPSRISPSASQSVETSSSETLIDDTISELCRLITKNNDEAFLKEFFCCLFTPPELKDIANRWLLVKEIDKGTTQREIAKKFSMSLCKITRGSRELSKNDSAFRKMLNILKETSD